jgi:hypothetical protein
MRNGMFLHESITGMKEDRVKRNSCNSQQEPTQLPKRTWMPHDRVKTHPLPTSHTHPHISISSEQPSYPSIHHHQFLPPLSLSLSSPPPNPLSSLPHPSHIPPTSPHIAPHHNNITQTFTTAPSIIPARKAASSRYHVPT